MTRARSGGGATMSKSVKVGVKGGARSANVGSPAGTNQLGAAQGTRMRREGSYTSQSSATPRFSGTTPNPVAFGNKVAASTVCGVGGSRTVHRSGSQTRHGEAVQGSSPAPRDILSEFGS